MVLSLNKVLGYILLIIGLICIFIAFRSMQDIFSQQTDPPEIFRMSSLDLTVSAGTQAPPTEVRVSLDPPIRKAVNIFLYYLFMFFAVMVGGKVGSLGIQLIKEKKMPDKA